MRSHQLQKKLRLPRPRSRKMFLKVLTREVEVMLVLAKMQRLSQESAPEEKESPQIIILEMKVTAIPMILSNIGSLTLIFARIWGHRKNVIPWLIRFDILILSIDKCLSTIVFMLFWYRFK